MDQEEYEKRYEGLVSRYEKAKDRLEKVEEQRQGRQVKRKGLETFISVLLKKDIIISDFDEALWHAVIGKVIVRNEDDVKFIFKDETVVKA